ncbi:MAG: hypothetical protein HYU88_10010 [Chloroflexi bacterium]|nr:hypothetical protein [Chloroflexota bacterium]
MSARGLLLAMTEVEPAAEPAFNRWYDERHLPRLRSVPGVLGARRFRALGDERCYLAIYDLAEVGVLDTPAYLRTRPWAPGAESEDSAMFAHFRNTVRGVYEHLRTLPQPDPGDTPEARALLLVGVEVPAAYDDEFNDWYSTEHLPLLTGVPGVLRARRYKLHAAASGIMGEPATYVALYDLAAPAVDGSAEWQRRRSTPWTDRLRPIYVRRWRTLFERIGPA